MPPQKELYTTGEAAKIFNRSDRTILRWIDKGRFPNAIDLPTGHVIPAADIIAEQQRQKGGNPA